MSTSIEVLEAEFMNLPVADRSRLLERLIASLDTDSEIEKAWVQEAERRDAEIESGAATEVPGAQALARIRSKLQ